MLRRKKKYDNFQFAIPLFVAKLMLHIEIEFCIDEKRKQIKGSQIMA